MDQNRIPHTPYGSLCSHCVKGRGVEDRRERKKHEDPWMSQAVSFDYLLSGEAKSGAAQTQAEFSVVSETVERRR